MWVGADLAQIREEKSIAMKCQDNEPETFEDDEFNRAVEESLREDRELLEKLAKI
jgi:hypothetical protein